jgi:hypothetical protein
MHQVRWVILVLGGALLLTGGVSLFSQPDHEVLYTTNPKLGVCTGEGCTLHYIMVLGNTGRQAQEEVLVRLRKSLVERAVLGPTARNFGKVLRPMQISDEGDVRTYALGRLEPMKRVEIGVTFQMQSERDAPAWDDILVKIEASRGEVKWGDPAAVTFGRVAYALVGGGCW